MTVFRTVCVYIVVQNALQILIVNTLHDVRKLLPYGLYKNPEFICPVRPLKLLLMYQKAIIYYLNIIT